MFFDIYSATPIKIATCVSWPHACITPVSFPLYFDLTLDLKSKLFFSVTGSASMSALNAKTFPGLVPLSIPTTPVLAISL